MNENPQAETPLKAECLVCLHFAKLALAGDMQSADLLNQLLERWSEIAWDDPGFIADSEKMRGTAPVLPINVEDIPVLRGLVHVLTEQVAARDETISTLMAHMTTASAQMGEALKSYRTQAKLTSELFNYIKNLIELHHKMRGRLEVLDADTSDYVIPELPTPPPR